MLDPAIRLARRTDPETSHLAAAEHVGKLSQRRHQTLLIVQWYPGRTSGELARLFALHFPNFPIRVAVETPHKRLPELAAEGLVFRGRVRNCEDSNQKAITWWSKEEAAESSFNHIFDPE